MHFVASTTGAVMIKRSIYPLILYSCFMMVFHANILGGAINTVCVILSSVEEPYQLAVNGYKKTIEKYSKPVFFEYVIKDQDQDSLATEIIKNNPDLILAAGTKALNFAKTAFPDKKISYCMVLAGEAAKNSNIAGVVLDIPEEYKLVETKKILPSAGSLGVIYSDSSLKQFENIKKACENNDIRLVGVKIEGEAGFQKALDKMKGEIDFFVMMMDSNVFSSKTIQYLFEESLDNKFPVIGLSSFYTKAGALISFEYNYNDVGVDTARLAIERFFPLIPVDKTEAAAKKCGYSLNVLVAQRLGIRLTQDTIQGAFEVFGK
jgi:putative ABC transport system substrate-binding protein